MSLFKQVFSVYAHSFLVAPFSSYHCTQREFAQKPHNLPFQCFFICLYTSSVPLYGTLYEAVYILLDGLIGEYDMETKISWIERKKLDESKADSLYKIIKLRDIVDELSRKK